MPPPPCCGIHDLNEPAVPPPGDDEMQQSTRLADDGNSRKDGLGRGRDVISRQQDLLGDQARIIGEIFEGVDGCSVHVGLAGFAQPTVARMDAEPVEKAFECGRTAVHGRGLDDFWCKKARSMALPRRHVNSRWRPWPGPAA